MKNIADITLDDVKSIMPSKGYPITTKEGVPNIVGIRNADKSSDIFIDRIWVWWNERGKEVSHFYTATTRPGFWYLEHPINNDGTGILVPGHYPNCWGLGMHRKQQFALCQKDGNGNMKAYRDKNLNNTIDCNPSTIQDGQFGCDGHHAGMDDGENIGHYSAMCQVWRFHKAHEDLMAEFDRMSKAYHYKYFSYTLLLQEDFI